MVRYQNGKAIEISVDRELRDEVKVSLYDLDVFHTPAEDVIRFMKQFGPCIHDEPDEQLSTEYEFPALGIRFWRERAFSRKATPGPCVCGGNAAGSRRGEAVFVF